ncbi:MAG TPA: hypothetical protein VMT35_16560 [Ignavibacteriaceae bacterium]|nr:hypothetical protein [Ignavibacteriaceae bacterium]
MKPIWYFVGLILFIMGLVITLTGLFLLSSPAQSKSVLYDLHPNIWWGAVMMIVGLIYIIKNRKVKIE